MSLGTSNIVMLAVLAISAIALFLLIRRSGDLKQQGFAATTTLGALIAASAMSLVTVPGSLQIVIMGMGLGLSVYLFGAIFTNCKTPLKVLSIVSGVVILSLILVFDGIF